MAVDIPAIREIHRTVSRSPTYVKGDTTKMPPTETAA